MAIPKILEHERKLKNIQDGEGELSIKESQSAEASGRASHTEGLNTTASGQTSHAEGSNTTASGRASHAEGYNTTASGRASHAEDYNTTASGSYSHAEGAGTKAEGYTSHAEGSNTTASGQASHAEGYNTTASDQASHAEGYNTTASDQTSHAEGSNTTASGQTSHAEGYNTTASGRASHAEGSKTTASGSYSHAAGYNTTASGRASHAEGSNTTANSNSQHAQGEYNVLDVENASDRGTYAHIVGNGTGDDARSNAHTIDWNGNAWFAGDVYVGSTSGTNKDEGSKILATQEYVDNSGGTFYATYQTTTYTEIVEAYNKGKSIILYYSNKFYPLIYIDDTTIAFGQRTQWNYGLSPQALYKVASDDTWSTTFWSDIYGNWSMTGTLQKSGGSVNLTSTTRYYRPILVSTSAPTSSDGQIGDIWIVYKT